MVANLVNTLIFSTIIYKFFKMETEPLSPEISEMNNKKKVEEKNKNEIKDWYLYNDNCFLYDNTNIFSSYNNKKNNNNSNNIIEQQPQSNNQLDDLNANNNNSNFFNLKKKFFFR